MFEYFPNYVWNLSLNLALAMGGSIGEIDEACRAIRNASASGDDDGTELFFSSWCRLGDQLVKLAEEDEKLGRNLSAGEKYGRAAVYYLTAERMQSRHYAARKQIYAAMLDCFSRYLKLAKEPATRIEVPYRSGAMACYFYPAQGTQGIRAPCVVFVNGLDGTKEMVYRVGIAQSLSRRGISTLIVDQPGVGEALRLHNLPAVIETEQWASVLVDYLETRPDVDPDRIGIMGWSLGGYYAPRAAAFQPRFKFCVAFGANYDWGEVQRRRRAKEGENPVPHYWDHVEWVWGKENHEEFMNYAAGITLKGVLDRIVAPALIVHGENDRQISPEYARKTYDELVNSPKKELKIFRAADGGVEHCSADAMDNPRDYIADWIAEVAGGRTF